MGTYLQTSELLGMNEESSGLSATLTPPPQDLLEPGWQGVATGLTRILIGYAMILGQGVFAGLLVAWVLLEASSGEEHSSASVGVLVVTAGLGILALLSFFAAIMIFTGKCVCAINAPELGGARWLIFACIVCMGAGVGLSIISTIAAVFSGGEAAVVSANQEQMLRIPAITVREVLSVGLNLGTTILFVFFLRAIAQRFEHRSVTRLIEFYLIFSALVLAGTFMMFFVTDNPLASPLLLVLVGLGWVIEGIWYVGLVALTRLLLSHELARPRRALV